MDKVYRDLVGLSSELEGASSLAVPRDRHDALHGALDTIQTSKPRTALPPAAALRGRV